MSSYDEPKKIKLSPLKDVFDCLFSSDIYCQENEYFDLNINMNDANVSKTFYLPGHQYYINYERIFTTFNDDYEIHIRIPFYNSNNENPVYFMDLIFHEDVNQPYVKRCQVRTCETADKPSTEFLVHHYYIPEQFPDDEEKYILDLPCSMILTHLKKIVKDNYTLIQIPICKKDEKPSYVINLKLDSDTYEFLSFIILSKEQTYLYNQEDKKEEASTTNHENKHIYSIEDLMIAVTGKSDYSYLVLEEEVLKDTFKLLNEMKNRINEKLNFVEKIMNDMNITPVDKNVILPYGEIELFKTFERICQKKNLIM